VSEPVITLTFAVSVLAMTFRMAVPLIFGTVGEAFAERSGVLNLGIEGMMLMGASVGYLVSYHVRDNWVGVAAAALAGAVMGLLMAFLTVSLGAQQHVAGIGTTIVGSGLSFYIYRLGVPLVSGIPPTVTPFPELSIPLLTDIPILGPVFFHHQALVYVALATVLISAFIFYRTRFGLIIRAVGENPRAADTAGIDVFRVRYLCLILAGALTAVGGSWLSIAQSRFFLPGMTYGRGWICIALVVFGYWSPLRILGGALIFGGIDALQLSLQAVGVQIPYQLFLMLPYVVTILALITVSRRAKAPAALLKPYRREE